jgi:hypothetical protein
MTSLRAPHVYYQAVQEVTQYLIPAGLEVRVVLMPEQRAQLAFSYPEIHKAQNVDNIVVTQLEGHAQLFKYVVVAHCKSELINGTIYKLFSGVFAGDCQEETEPEG